MTQWRRRKRQENFVIYEKTKVRTMAYLYRIYRHVVLVDVVLSRRSLMLSCLSEMKRNITMASGDGEVAALGRDGRKTSPSYWYLPGPNPMTC